MRDITHGRKFSIFCFQVRLFLITLGCSFISVALAVLILPSVIILYSMYMVVYLYMKIKYGDTVSRANGLDIMYSINYTGSTPFLNTVQSLDGNITLEDIRDNCMRFLSPESLKTDSKVFRRAWQKMERHFGYTFFRDDANFEMEKHAVILTKEDLFGSDEPEEYMKKILSDESEDAYGEFIKQEGQIICQRMLELYGNKEIPLDIPQWQIIYYKHPGIDRCTIMFHGHHCISDGIGVLRYFLEHFGDKKVDYTLPYTFHQNSWIKRLGVNILSFCMLPFGIWRLTYQRGNNPLHGPALSGEKMYIKSRLYSVTKMKEVKEKCGCTMITLLFNSLAYALRCNYRRKGVNIRKSIAIVPVPLHDFSKPPRFMNNHGLQGILLRTDALDPENDSALNRLEETKKLLYISVRDPSFLPIQWIIKNIGPLLPIGVNKAVFKLKGFTTSFSNIAGPMTEYFTICNGKGIGRESLFWVPDRDPMGMGLSSGGYMGQCAFGLIVDKALMKNYREGHMFLNDFIQEFENLRKELQLDDYIE